MEGQIYIPVANWLLGLLTLACVLIFRSNTAIGNGFGKHSHKLPFTVSACLCSWHGHFAISRAIAGIMHKGDAVRLGSSGSRA